MPRKLLDGSRKREAIFKLPCKRAAHFIELEKPEGADGCGKVAEPIRDCGFLREHFSGAKRRGADRAK